MNAPATGASRRFRFVLAALAFWGLAAPVEAQEKLISIPADKFITAPGGVDMRTGRFVYNEADLAIGGEGSGGLTLARILTANVLGHSNPFANLSHNWDIMVSELRINIDDPGAAGQDFQINVHFGGRSQTYQARYNSIGYQQMSPGAWAPLTYTGDRAGPEAVYTYEAAGGTVVRFRPIGHGDCSSAVRCAYVSEITEPDGTRFTFTYAASGSSGGAQRLERVTSSRGYQLVLEGSGSHVTRACVLNLARTPAPTAASCPADVPAATYGYSGGKLVSATGPDNATAGFTYAPAGDGSTAMSFVKPGESAAWLTNIFHTEPDELEVPQEIVDQQYIAHGQSYSYSYDRSPVLNKPRTIAGGTYTNARNEVTEVKFDWPTSPGQQYPGAPCRSLPCAGVSQEAVRNRAFQLTPGPVSIRDPMNGITRFDYCDAKAMADPAWTETNRCIVHQNARYVVDPEGIRTDLEYDDNHNVKRAVRHPRPGVPNPDGTSPAPIVTSAVYVTTPTKAANKPLSMTDARGHTTTWTYFPEHGGVDKETGPAVNGVTPQKRHFYMQLYARAPDGNVFGPPAPVWLLERMSTCRTGNPSGDGCALGPSDEVVTVYDYGPDRPGTNLNLLGQAVTADGQTLRTCFAYDGLGRKISETSPNGTAGLSSCPYTAPATGLPYTTSTRYDADGRVTGTIAPDPDGPGGNGAPAVRNSYDPAGRLTKVEQGALAAWLPHGIAPSAWTGFTVHKAIDTSFDALDRKTREAVSGVDGGGALVVKAVTEYGYDKAGRLWCTAVRMNPAEWAASLPENQDHCRLPGLEGPHGSDRITRNVYDKAGRLTETWEGVGTPLQRREVHYTYNGNGQKLSVTDARGFKAELTYDGHGRQSRWIFPSRTTPGVADPGDLEYYLYDPNGNRTKLRKRDQSVLAYQYDALNRMTAKIVEHRGSLAAYTRDTYYEYDLRGLQTAASFSGAPNDFVRTWYDGFGRPVTVLTHMFGQPRYLNHQYDRDGNRELLTHTNDNAHFRYFHDGLGRVTHVADNPAVAGPDDYVIRYHYRPEGPRYVAIRGAGAGGFTTAYHYDPVQRLRMMANDLPGAGSDMTVTLDYNPASQIRHYGRDNDAYAWTGTIPASRAYTTNGQNQYLASGPTAFSYDANGNLIWDSSSNYVYDVENRLVGASGEKSAALVYDPLGRLAQINGPSGVTRFHYDGDKLVAEYDFAGNLLRRYVHGPGVDEPVAVYEGPALGLAGRRYMLPDERGSIAALINANGTPSAINTYNEYGVPGTEPVGRFGYTGQTWIPELGLWYYKARFYSSRLGRFLQVDPIGYDDQFNLYAYVANDPVNHTDPTGEQLVERHKADREVVARVNAAVSTGKPQTIRLDTSTRMTVQVQRGQVRVSISHKATAKVFGLPVSKTVTVSGTGTANVRPGNVTISNIRLKSETLGVTVKSAPSSLTLRNEPNGRIGIHTNGPLVVSTPVNTITKPKIDAYIDKKVK